MPWSSDPAVITYLDVVLAVTVSLLLGLYTGFVYRKVTPRFNHSVSTFYTLLYLAMIVSLVMIVVSNQIARAFTLVGALAVIRFRTAIKDVREAAFIFLSLAAGMGVGVGLYLETALGTFLIGAFMFLLHHMKIGLRVKREVLVKFTVPVDDGERPPPHREIFERFLADYQLLNIRSLQESGELELVFLVKPAKDADLMEFSRALSSVPQLGKVSVMVFEEEDAAQNVF